MRTILCIGLMAVAPAIWAEDFSTTPKPETLQDAIRFQKNKDAADAAQARKEAGLPTRASDTTARKSKVTTAKTTKSSDHKTGQADSSKK
jgi:hypothetical protein